MFVFFFLLVHFSLPFFRIKLAYAWRGEKVSIKTKHFRGILLKVQTYYKHFFVDYLGLYKQFILVVSRTGSLLYRLYTFREIMQTAKMSLEWSS